MGTQAKFASVKIHFADGNSVTFKDAAMVIVDAPVDGWTIAAQGKHHFVNARHVVLVVAELDTPAV